MNHRSLASQASGDSRLPYAPSEDDERRFRDALGLGDGVSSAYASAKIEQTIAVSMKLKNLVSGVEAKKNAVTMVKTAITAKNSRMG